MVLELNWSVYGGLRYTELVVLGWVRCTWLSWVELGELGSGDGMDCIGHNDQESPQRRHVDWVLKDAGGSYPGHDGAVLLSASTMSL